MEENTRENKMGTMPIGKLLANMAGPVMISMLFQALYNIVDSVFVARLSQDAMNAVSLAFPLQTLCIAFAVGTGVGMNALLARSLGEKNMQAVDRAAGTGLFLTLCTAAVFAVLGFSLATPFFRFQTENAQITSPARTYSSSSFSGSGKVGYIGYDGFLKFAQVTAPKDGVYLLRIRLTIAVVALAVAVIGMIFIAVTNKNVGYFHAEQKVQDKYAYWEEQLDAREKELQEWEEELSEQAEKNNDAKTQN